MHQNMGNHPQTAGFARPKPHNSSWNQTPLQPCSQVRGPSRAVFPTLLPSSWERGRCSKDPEQACMRMRAALAASLKLASEEDSGRGLNGEMPADQDKQAGH